MGSPIVALELAVGGTDVPMVAFLCLGFGLLAKGLADARGPGIGAAGGVRDVVPSGGR